MLYLLLAILLAMAPLICLISLVDSVGVRQELETHTREFRNQTESGVTLSILLVDTGLKLFDNTLNHEMAEGCGPVLAEYERAGRDPAEMDLLRVREELGGRMDIYVVNANGVIEYTTYAPDLGLDFREIPSFYDRITELRLGDAFAADRVVTGIAAGELRKYAYMPSPDHRYLFELGLVCSSTDIDRYDPRYQTLREELVRLHPAVTGIRIFDCYGRLINVTDPVDPVGVPAVNPVAVEVFETKEDRTLTDSVAGTITRYIFVDLSDPRYPSDASRIVELTSTTAPLDARLAEMRFSHAFIVILASLVACGIAIPVSRRITRPVREIADDVNRIARGDLDHRIRLPAGTEFARLSKSISAMVDSLKENIRRLQESEATSRQYSARLEEQVRERTADLEESNRAAALFLDIMVHDINNSNTIAIG